MGRWEGINSCSYLPLSSVWVLSQGQGAKIPGTEKVGIKGKRAYGSRMALMNPCSHGFRTSEESSRSQKGEVESVSHKLYLCTYKVSR